MATDTEIKIARLEAEQKSMHTEFEYKQKGVLDKLDEIKTWLEGVIITKNETRLLVNTRVEEIKDYIMENSVSKGDIFKIVNERIEKHEKEFHCGGCGNNKNQPLISPKMVKIMFGVGVAAAGAITAIFAA